MTPLCGCLASTSLERLRALCARAASSGRRGTSASSETTALGNAASATLLLTAPPLRAGAVLRAETFRPHRPLLTPTPHHLFPTSIEAIPVCGAHERWSGRELGHSLPRRHRRRRAVPCSSHGAALDSSSPLPARFRAGLYRFVSCHYLSRCRAATFALVFVPVCLGHVGTCLNLVRDILRRVRVPWAHVSQPDSGYLATDLFVSSCLCASRTWARVST
jgi:hypothetical protein